MLDELQKIGPCRVLYSENNPGEFVVSGEKTMKTCDWFVEKPGRCANFSEGREQCPASCKDTKFRVEGQEFKKSCKWFEYNTKRCNKYYEGRINCPKECFQSKGFC